MLRDMATPDDVFIGQVGSPKLAHLRHSGQGFGIHRLHTYNTRPDLWI